MYIVEDTHACYWQYLGGGLRNPRSFVEHAKLLVDAQHADYLEEEPALPVTAASVPLGIHFYDSLLVIEKGALGTKEILGQGSRGLNLSLEFQQANGHPSLGEFRRIRLGSL
jgi:hypothetical protein